jgi:nitroimidazol reductase NimA-like FMN-containing flavoprotein (pyridoxamine 5'-phosphate oxidase superfamily)
LWYDTWIDQRGSEILARPECARLLAIRSGGVGRLGMVVHGQPVVIPLNYRMVDGDVVIRIGPGTILSTVREGHTIVAFEIDHTPEDYSSAWWSVLVQGLAVTAGDLPTGVRAVAAAPVPAVPEPGQAVVRIRTEVLTGRRFSAAEPDRGDADPSG